MSNIGYVNKYGSSIFGLTGTLGSTAEQGLLSSIYNLDYAKISTYKEKRCVPLNQLPPPLFLIIFHCFRFAELDGLVVEDAMWADAVVVDALVQTDAQRAVLIVCQTIKDTLEVQDRLVKLIGAHMASGVRLRLYQDEDGAQETRKPLESGDIVISTNIAGRGTDFKTSPQVEQAGGVYVCVGFLPYNKRVEDQAFGRTSRQGNNGSAKLVLRRSELDYSSGQAFESIKGLRDRIEASRIKEIREVKVGELMYQDYLFAEFTKLYRSVGDEMDETEAVYVLKDLKEAWAFWLDGPTLHVQGPFQGRSRLARPGQVPRVCRRGQSRPVEERRRSI